MIVYTFAVIIILLILIRIFGPAVYRRLYGAYTALVGKDEHVTTTDPPFTIMIRDQAESDWNSGFEFDIRCKEDTSVNMFWGVETKLISRLTDSPTSFTATSSSLEQTFTDHSTYTQGPMRVQAECAHRLIALPDRDFTLGLPPRDRVPLVLLCTVRDVNVLESEIVSMITVVHIRDEHCTDITSKIKEVVCLKNGFWMSISRYYDGGRVDGGMCVVCRDVVVNRILLPCRHMCLCDLCVQDADQHCPMCGMEFTSSVVV